METNTIYTRTPNAPFESVEVTKKCPKCQSVFITEKECESCHYQFNVEAVGSPYGFKSVTYIRSDFANDFPYISFLKDNFSYKVSSSFPAVIEYRRKLNRRREVLCRYLFESVNGDRETRKLFFTELLDVSYELINLDTDVYNILERLDGHEKHPFYEKLSRLLFVHQENRKRRENPFRKLINASAFGLLRVRFLLTLAICSGVILFLGIYFFSEVVELIS